MFRIGQSSDIHRLTKGEYITLGGVKINCEYALVAHSDGDALLHAIAESILGALALGDLGHHFPDNDPKWENANSLDILASVINTMEDKGYKIGNIDSLILIQKPKMAPHIQAMQENIARVCHCHLNQVNVKATTGEKLGYIGQSEGIMAQAVVLLYEQ